MHKKTNLLLLYCVSLANQIISRTTKSALAYLHGVGQWAAKALHDRGWTPAGGFLITSRKCGSFIQGLLDLQY